MNMFMNAPLSAGADGIHALDPSQGGWKGKGVGMVDGQALESQVMLLMQKVEGYRKEVEELKMRHKEMKEYVRSVVEMLKRQGERCCLGVENGEILLCFLFFSLLIKLFVLALCRSILPLLVPI
jgi:hypothetical protein